MTAQQVTQQRLAVSPLWSSATRTRVQNSHKREVELNNEKRKRRAAELAGNLEAVNQDPKQSTAAVHATLVPILLVQRGLVQTPCTTSQSCTLGKRHTEELSTREEFANGWTLIIPKRWGHAFWRSLIFAGAKAASQSCMDTSVAYHSGVPRFPKDWPGIDAAEVEAEREEELEMEKVKRKPPAKRGFSLKDALTSTDTRPGRYLHRGDFSELVRLSSGMACDSPKDVRVVYSPMLLRKINLELRVGSFSSYMEFSASLAAGVSVQLPEDTLVPVALQLSTGLPVDSALLYRIASPSVLDLFKESESQALLNEESPEAREKWLNAQVQYSPGSEDLAGIVTSGGYSLARGRGFAFAVCSLKRIVEVKIALGSPMLLLRNKGTMRCRLASIEILQV